MKPLKLSVLCSLPLCAAGFLAILNGCGGTASSSSGGSSQPPQIKHIVVIVQENRTPDNLFQSLCSANDSSCLTHYNLQNFGINSQGTKIPLTPTSLGTNFDIGHTHADFVAMCDLDPNNKCKMDGADKTVCISPTGCPPNFQFEYVRSSDVGPYITMAQQYGWANFMFQTNQGPSTPAHQFIFAGTSAPDATDDANATFVTENPSGLGCQARVDEIYKLISPTTAPNETEKVGKTCFSHPTMASLLDGNSHSWRYYTPGSGSIWTAPNWIRDICQPDSTFKCTGQEWINNVDLIPQDVLTDIGGCNLADVSWVIPTAKNSDHAGVTDRVGGPSWVASIVNAIGNSSTCDNNAGYWQDTAILITWDDWGGWFDHEAPTLLTAPNQGQGDYQYGFRVPLVVISAYTPVGYVDNDRLDFGSILRFIESTFGMQEGALNFADARATTDLSGFINLQLAPRTFTPISASKDAKFFLNDKSPMEPPDDD